MKLQGLTLIGGLCLLVQGYTPIRVSEPWKDEVFDDRIRTVQLYREGWNLSYPVIKLNSDERLVLDFDLLGDNPENYYYAFVHCDRDWNESSVFLSDYINGINEERIEDYKPSFNTKTSYYHYRILFPDDRMSFRLSGNYIIKVYTTGSSEKPVLTRRFIVSENKAYITANIHRPSLAEYYNTGQQVDFTVSFPDLKVNNPSKDISTVILQNGKWYDSKTGLKPDIVNSSELKFNSLSSDNIFPGGNEYRYFDIKSLHYQSEFIRRIDFVDDRYHVYLSPSETREFKPYFYEPDLNGKYYVAIKEGRNMETDADYVYVYFTLPSRQIHEDGDLYVSGALANWEFKDANRMIYDQSKEEYQCSMLLKQGWYNYEYIFVKKGEPVTAPSLFESNHFETENDYQVIVYYRGPGERYDRVIAVATAKSSKQGN